MAEVTWEQVKDYLSNMSVLDLSEKIKELEDEWGVSASAPVAVAAGPAAGADEGEDEEKDAFDVVLTGYGDNKIKVIKEVRAITDLGLKEAKDLVEAAPKTIREAVGKEDAEELKERLEGAGGSVDIK